MSEKNIDKKIDNMEEAVEKYASANTVISIGGYEFTPAKLMVAFTLVSSILGGLYGAFEVYKDYQGMKKAITEYVAPDLSGIQEQLSVMKAEMRKIQDSVIEARDYTRDIKVDLKKDVDRLENVVQKTEQRVKDAEDKVRNMIDVANGRFETKRDELRNDSERKMKDLEDRLQAKLQKALDNPLAK